MQCMVWVFLSGMSGMCNVCGVYIYMYMFRGVCVCTHSEVMFYNMCALLIVIISIMDIREFEWESQLRFYWEPEPDTLMIRQCTGTFGFGFEYMGLNGRLVITPLTDRIYLTLSQALSMQLGGAPAGPAGTGKTETVKDLAKALGLLCVVTNCGEGMDYKVSKTRG